MLPYQQNGPLTELLVEHFIPSCTPPNGNARHTLAVDPLSRLLSARIGRPLDERPGFADEELGHQDVMPG